MCVSILLFYLSSVYFRVIQLKRPRPATSFISLLLFMHKLLCIVPYLLCCFTIEHSLVSYYFFSFERVYMPV
jgi:hypothetical protein